MNLATYSYGKIGSSRTKTSLTRLVSLGTRLEAAEVNATTRPLPSRSSPQLESLACVPSAPRLTRRIMPVRRSLTNTSPSSFVSSGTRLAEPEPNAMERPSSLIAGGENPPIACAPSNATLTRVVVPVWRSCTKMSPVPLVSSATRLVASDWNATNRPSALISGAQLESLACSPVLLTLDAADAGVQVI